jgi:small-conductance mechanosensitive channel/CRP-like cAMP-binding protein
MEIWAGITAEFADDRTLPLLVVGLVLVATTRALAVEGRERARSGMLLLMLHLLLVPIAGILHATGSAYYRETRLAALMAVTFALIGLVGVLLFTVLIPRTRINVPRILQDVLIAAVSTIAVFTLATHAGLNLSGLIATSAVLTAVIGLAFQDTLGNVVGGLALQLDESVGVGDWIKVGDVTGKVTVVRWRYTAVETRNWETVILPNSLLVKGQVLVLGRRTGQPLQLRRWVYFNVDYRFAPNEVIDAVLAALRGVRIDRVAENPTPTCVLMDLDQSSGRYAVRYWLTDLAIDDPTDSVVRTRVYYALRRAGIPLSLPAQQVFFTADTDERASHHKNVDPEKCGAVLARVDLFARLADEERAQLIDHVSFAAFAPGEIITRQGAEAHWLYVLANGRATVRVKTNDSSEAQVNQLDAVDIFGEMSLLTGEPRAATVVAETAVECYRLDRQVFQALLKRRPELAEHMADVLSTRSVQLAKVREGLDHDAARARHGAMRTDLLYKIRDFFGLSDDPPSAGPS